MKNKKIFLLLSSTIGIVAPVTTVMSMNLQTKNIDNVNKQTKKISSPPRIESRWYNYTTRQGHNEFVEQTFLPTNVANNWRYHGPEWATQLMYAVWTADGGKTASGRVGQAAKTWANAIYQGSFDKTAYNARNSIEDSIGSIYSHIGKKGVTVETVSCLIPIEGYFSITTYTEVFTDHQTGPF